MGLESRGVFLDLDTIDAGDIDVGSLAATLPHWEWRRTTTVAEVAGAIAGAHVVVSNKVRLHGEVLAEASRLRLICIAATGVDNVDLHAAAALGIPVCNVRAYATASVVQHVFALILALTTRLFELRDATRAGRWQQCKQFCLLDFPVHELQGKRLGIVGYGELGRRVAAVGEAFGLEVLLAQRPGGPSQRCRVPLGELLPLVDVLTLHCPLTRETRGLIGARELARMRPNAILINTARGGIVDERALAEALERGRIAGAGIDVLAAEPPTANNPLLRLDSPRLILTPHTAWASRESRQRLLEEVAGNVRAFKAGRPRNLVGLALA